LVPYDAEHVILLPNNSNIILTANQVAELYKDADVHVIPTKSIVQGYSALSMLDLWCEDVETLIADMSAGLNSVVSAGVTTATRDAVIGGVSVKEDEFLGLKNKEIVLSNPDRFEAETALIDHVMEEEEKAVIVVFYGQHVDTEETERLQAYLEDKYPLTDIGFIDGKQDVYDYIISME
jgi:dihydroxyacetone kinase-like predicted kinase